MKTSNNHISKRVEDFLDESGSYSSKDSDSVVSDDDIEHQSATSSGRTGVSASEEQVDELKQINDLAIKETRNMRWWKIALLLAMLTTAVCVASQTYLFLDREEQKEFETAYHEFSLSIEDRIKSYHSAIASAVSSVGGWMSLQAQESNQTFPFITLDTFGYNGLKTVKRSKAHDIIFAPLVTNAQRKQWEEYSVQHQDWVNKSRALDKTLLDQDSRVEHAVYEPITPRIYQVDSDNHKYHAPPATAETDGFFAPWWQSSPVPRTPSVVNANLFTHFDGSSELFRAVYQARVGLYGPHINLRDKANSTVDEYYHELTHAELANYKVDVGTDLDETEIDESALKPFHDLHNGHGHKDAYDHPHSLFLQPMFLDIHDKSSPIVGVLCALLAWDAYMVNLLPEGVEGVDVVLKNDCGEHFMYNLKGPTAFFVGNGDSHDVSFDQYEVVIPFFDPKQKTDGIANHCRWSVYLYPTQVFASNYQSNLPSMITFVISAAFFVMALFFSAYDKYVHRRNRKISSAAARANTIVSSLFPSQIRDRLFERNQVTDKAIHSNKNRLKAFLNTGEDKMDTSKPIADLFPHATVMFADLVGFTAWSSTREPCHVFELLESIYAAFDEVAKARRVFKVETVGDCYVAVAGLPEPRDDHAVVMCRFARDCLSRMRNVTYKLDETLGPGTADLTLRVGIHSGPVTAGVLRGERARFQLFGDTMNTTARVESTGKPGMIHLSKDTALLLEKWGKSTWATPREEKVFAKGKGEMETFWLSTRDRGGSKLSKSGTSSSSETSSVGSSLITIEKMDTKAERLANWCVEVLVDFLNQIEKERPLDEQSFTVTSEDEAYYRARSDSLTVFDEVREIIVLPGIGEGACKDTKSKCIGASAQQQLKAYVVAIANMYRDNPFHNFVHAAHVMQSVVKLLSRIISPELEGIKDQCNLETLLHQHTYGITSDPLTRFTCVFSALIHDVDHSGVPNTQLIKENPCLASCYKGRSIAEQNSVDLAWDLLMEDSFSDLRKAIYRTPEELSRFRQLLVNSVMATDVMDKDLKLLRNQRWDKAFSGDEHSKTKTDVDRKATIVIEHMIQASDVSHTMQHWHIYRKWNENLFRELYKAFKEGRATTNPAEFWYKGEMGFFDSYIIPLAKKLKNCGVFGVSSDEFLSYAEHNRMEWERKGTEIVATMMQQLHREEMG